MATLVGRPTNARPRVSLECPCVTQLARLRRNFSLHSKGLPRRVERWKPEDLERSRRRATDLDTRSEPPALFKVTSFSSRDPVPFFSTIEQNTGLHRGVNMNSSTSNTEYLPRRGRSLVRVSTRRGWMTADPHGPRVPLTICGRAGDHATARLRPALGNSR